MRFTTRGKSEQGDPAGKIERLSAIIDQTKIPWADKTEIEVKIFIDEINRDCEVNLIK